MGREKPAPQKTKIRQDRYTFYARIPKRVWKKWEEAARKLGLFLSREIEIEEKGSNIFVAEIRLKPILLEKKKKSGSQRKREEKPA